MSPLSHKTDTDRGKNDPSSTNLRIGHRRLNKLDQITESPHKPDELAELYFFHHNHQNQSMINQNKRLEPMSPKEQTEQ